MIAGPILPRTADGLWCVVQDDPGRIEHGLKLLRLGLELDGGVRIDALATDASGRPVLMFGSLVEHDLALPARIVDAVAWFARGATMLQSLVDGHRVRLELPPRVIVIGFEFTERCLSRLRGDDSSDLLVVRIDAIRIGGRDHVGAVVVHGGDGFGNAWLAALATGEPASRVERFADLMHRLDEQLGVDGDRFARTWRCDGVPIVRLERAPRSVMAVIPGHPPLSLSSEESVEDAIDLASRRYLGLIAGFADEAMGPQRSAMAELWSGEARAERVGGTVATAPARERLARATDQPLPAAFASEVTRAEYDAFFANKAEGDTPVE